MASIERQSAWARPILGSRFMGLPFGEVEPLVRPHWCNCGTLNSDLCG